MNTSLNIIGYRQTLLGERRRLEEALAEATMVYNHSPQLLEARQRGAAPNVYHHYRRKASHARIGAYAMWLICLSLGGGFTILAYSIPYLSPLISGLIILFVWAAAPLHHSTVQVVCAAAPVPLAPTDQTQRTIHTPPGQRRIGRRRAVGIRSRLL